MATKKVATGTSRILLDNYFVFVETKIFLSYSILRRARGENREGLRGTSTQRSSYSNLKNFNVRLTERC